MVFEIADRLLAALGAGRRVAVATPVSGSGSAPPAVGTSMAVTDDGAVIGSISGGCVEGAVYEMCQRALATGSSELARFGFSDETAFSVGLSCGGTIEVATTVLVPGVEAAGVEALRAAASGSATSMTMILSGSRLGEVIGDPAYCDDARVFTESSSPPARLIIFGAVEFSVALCNAAAVLGYRVTVCDPRPVFATAERFPAAHEVVVAWPPDYLRSTASDDRTVVCILSHDERFDVDLIEAALRRPFAYVGAMGSRSTHGRRMEELERRGIRDLDRLHSPIGLDIGGSTPEETAISILAEVLAARSGATGAPLRAVGGSIHASR